VHRRRPINAEGITDMIGIGNLRDAKFSPRHDDRLGQVASADRLPAHASPHSTQSDSRGRTGTCTDTTGK